jgi:hypothetical protein
MIKVIPIHSDIIFSITLSATILFVVNYFINFALY